MYQRVARDRINIAGEEEIPPYTADLIEYLKKLLKPETMRPGDSFDVHMYRSGAIDLIEAMDQWAKRGPLDKKEEDDGLFAYDEEKQRYVEGG